MAKTATYWQRGETLDYVNGTGTLIPAGTVLAVGSKHIGVAGIFQMGRPVLSTSWVCSRSRKNPEQPWRLAIR